MVVAQSPSDECVCPANSNSRKEQCICFRWANAVQCNDRRRAAVFLFLFYWKCINSSSPHQHYRCAHCLLPIISIACKCYLHFVLPTMYAAIQLHTYLYLFSFFHMFHSSSSSSLLFSPCRPHFHLYHFHRLAISTRRLCTISRLSLTRVQRGEYRILDRVWRISQSTVKQAAPQGEKDLWQISGSLCSQRGRCLFQFIFSLELSWVELCTLFHPKCAFIIITFLHLISVHLLLAGGAGSKGVCVPVRHCRCVI